MAGTETGKRMSTFEREKYNRTVIKDIERRRAEPVGYELTRMQ